MDENQYAQRFELIFRKIRQVIRIKQALEMRREEWISKLKISNDYETTKEILYYLLDVYKRELRVLEYSKKGLEESVKLLQEAEISLLGPEKQASMGKTLINVALNRFIPFYNKFLYDPETIRNLIRLIYREVKNMIGEIQARITVIEKHIFQQYLWVMGQIRDSAKGNLLSNVTWDEKSYRQFEEEHDREMKLINDIKAGILTNKLKTKLLEKIRKIDQALSKNEGLAKLQSFVILMTSSFVSVPVSTYFLEGTMIFAGVACFAVTRQAFNTVLYVRLKNTHNP